MFPKPHDQSPPHSAVNHHLITTTTSNSEETDTKKESKTTINCDGGSIEAVRRPRGRPPGTKNKRKSSSVSVTNGTTDVPSVLMSPYVLEVSGGSDIVAALTQFCNHRKTSLCVLSGSGSVSSVSFGLPTSTTAVKFQGCFSLLSISATVIPSSSSVSANSDFVGDNKFMVSIASPNGKTFGGAVVAPLIASGTVYIVAACFNNPIFLRLPTTEDDHEDIISSIMNNNNSSNDSNNSGFVAGGYIPAPLIGGSGHELAQHHHAAASAVVVESLMSRLPPYDNSHLPEADFTWPPSQYI